MSEESRPYNKTLGLIRLLAVFSLIAVLVWLTWLARPTVTGVTIGAAIVTLGEAIRLWASGHLYKTVELITSGPYRYTRNPMYLGRLVIFTGIAVMARLPFHAQWIVLLVGYAIFFGYYLPRKERVEPARLRAIHGEDYDRYFKAVPALFPALRPYAQGRPGAWLAERMLRNREYMMVIGLAAVTLILLWRAMTPSL